MNLLGGYKMMNLVPVEDMNYLVNQSCGSINMILSGMIALMNDTYKKIEIMESQDWFQRMIKTVIGKDNLTDNEIKQNHDKLNTYICEAITELYNRNCIDDKVIMSLGIQLNELYAESEQLKEMLGEFISKLNEKLDSIDNFHILTSEINQGIYSSNEPVFVICKIISQFDKGILNDIRKLDVIRGMMVLQNIINDDEIQLSDYLMSILEIPVDEIGAIYLELRTIKDNFMAKVIIEIIERYHFLPDISRKIKNKDNLIEKVINNEKMDKTIKLSVSYIYDDFISSKVDINNKLVQIRNKQVELIIKKAEQLYLECKLDKAFEIFRDLAEKGNAYSQFRLGSFYEYGEEVEKSIKESFKWYKKAAENGEVNAQYKIGYCYEHGQGVEKNLKESFKWYKKAADNGDINAQYMVGYCYQYGLGIEKNFKESFKWYKKAVDNGDINALFSIAKCYEYGEGVERNLKEAFKWYVKAANSNIDGAATEVGKIEINNCNYSEAIKWFKKDAEKGYADAQNRLGVRYYKGEGVEINREDAFKYFMKAAEQGHTKAQTNVGICYHFGRGVLSDDEKSKEWLRKASNKGYDPASSLLSKWYKEGNSSISNVIIKDIYEDAYESIKSLCELFIKEHDASQFDVSYKLKCGLGIQDCNKIYLAHDDTLFKNGKNGFAITSDGIFCRVFLELYTRYIPFTKLSKVSDIYWKNADIHADDNIIGYYCYSDSVKDDLVDLFWRIKRLVSFD